MRFCVLVIHPASPSSIDDQITSGNKRGGGGTEKDSRIGDFLRMPHAPHRVASEIVTVEFRHMAFCVTPKTIFNIIVPGETVFTRNP